MEPKCHGLLAKQKFKFSYIYIYINVGIYIHKSFSATLDKDLRKNKKEMEQLENINNKVETLIMK